MHLEGISRRRQGEDPLVPETKRARIQLAKQSFSRIVLPMHFSGTLERMEAEKAAKSLQTMIFGHSGETSADLLDFGDFQIQLASLKILCKSTGCIDATMFAIQAILEKILPFMALILGPFVTEERRR